MHSPTTEKLLSAIIKGDSSGADTAFRQAMSEKVRLELDIRKVAVAAKYFSATSK